MGLSQDDFAKRLGVSRNYVSMIEGGRDPSKALIQFFETIEREHFGTPDNVAEGSPSDEMHLRDDGHARYGELSKITSMVNPEIRARLKTLEQRSGINEEALVGYALAMYLAECESKKQIIIPMQ